MVKPDFAIKIGRVAFGTPDLYQLAGYGLLIFGAVLILYYNLFMRISEDFKGSNSRTGEILAFLHNQKHDI